MDFEFFLTINYAPCIGILFLLLFLQFNGRTDQKIQHIFHWLLAFEFIELVAYSLELVTAMRPEPSMLRILLSAIGYTLRPVLVYLLIILNMRDRITRRTGALIAVPLLINTAVAFSAFFTDLAYSYTAENLFVRGPLGYTAQIITLLYLVAFGVLIMRNAARREKLETRIVMMSMILVVAAMVIEALFYVRSLGRTSIVMATVFYYMYFQSDTYQNQLEAEKNMRSQLQQVFHKDGLTGLLNKEGFQEQIEQHLEKKHISSALIFFDLDHFKEFNDTLGHLTGDELLKEVAVRLNQLFRSTDAIGRFGGDEFYIYMTDITYSITEQKARKLLDAMQITWKDGTIGVTASIGICYIPSEIAISSREALHIADEALYEAKRIGRNCFCIHTAGAESVGETKRQT